MENVHPVINVLNQLWPLKEESKQAFEEIILFKKYAKTDLLLDFGGIAKNLFFIQKGLARVYYLKDDLDVTDYFALENQFVGATRSLFLGLPAKKAIELLEDSQVFYFNYQAFDQLCIKYSDLERVARKLSIYGMLEEQKRIESIRFLSARERYWELEKKYPGITNRVSLQHIASYLNTTNVSLSRIRAGKQ